MNWKSFGRLLVCLVLVCVILVNCSPIQAKAVEPVTMMIGAGIVIAAAIIGLGVMMGSDPVVFDELVSKVASHEKMSDIISVDFKLPVIRYNAITGGIDPNGMSWALSVLVLESIREILFDEDVVLDESIPEGSASYNGTILKEFTAHSYSAYPAELILFSKNSSRYSYYCASGYSVTGDNIVINSHLVVNSYVVYNNVYSNWQYSAYGSKITHSLDEYDLIWSNLDVLDSSGNVFFSGSEPVFGSRLGLSDGLTAGEIAPQTQTILDGYPSWSSGSLIDENQNYWYPIGFGQTYDETKTYTQEQVQSGESTYQEEDIGSDEGSDSVTATGLKKWISDFKSSVDMWFARVSLSVSNILDALSSLPQAITAPIIDALDYIFVPREDFVSDKFDELRKEFAFADTLITGGQMIGDAFNGFDTSPPIIYIDLGSTRGDYDIGGKVPFIDLTWYEEYKPTVDMLLSSFLWVVFIWKLFQKAPGIISGMPGDFVMEGLQQLNMDVYLPMRSQSHEKVRRLNRRSKL